MQSGFLMLRKPMPVARSIHWVPVGSNSDAAVSGADVPLFITQGALREAMRHLRSDPEQELMGFLLGNLFECPDSGSRYVVITSAMRTGHVIGETEPVQIPEEEWLGMQLELRRRRAGLMGWYHSSPFVGSSPARIDIDTHRERFHEVWQSGLVIATTGPEPTGGFFRLMPGNGGALNGMLIPFDEIVEDDALLPGGRKRTLIDWANYRTEQPIEGDRSERRPHIPPPRRATPDPVDPALANMTGQPTLPVMLPEPSDFAFDDMPLQPQPEVRRLRFGAMAAILLLVGVGAAGYWWWNHRGTLEPPAGLGAMLSSPAASAPAANRLRDTSTYTPPQDTAGIAANSSLPPTVPPSAMDTTGLTKPGAARSPDGGTMTAQPPVQAAPQPVVTQPAATPPVTLPAPNAAPASPDAKTQRFDALADSLAQAIRNFQDRDADFTTKRLTCRGLAVGYQSADDAYIALAGAYRNVRATIDGARDARFRKLSSAVGDVNNTFDASKCPRP
jgi:proteasome lid subunit RPN8/RPN11